MSFRVLIFGSPSFHDYAKLRSMLDIALSKRLPDVELIALVKAKGLLVRVVEMLRDEGGQGKNRGGGRCGWSGQPVEVHKPLSLLSRRVFLGVGGEAVAQENVASETNLR
jgi:hypothetical protein